MHNDDIEILLVEDDGSDLELTLEALRGSAAAPVIQVARDGEEALDRLFGGEGGRPGDFALVLLDLHLPRLDGHEVLRRIKGDPRTRHIPVVVLTGSRAADDLRNTYELGGNSFLEKPADSAALRALVRHAAEYWLQVNRAAPTPQVPAVNFWTRAQRRRA